MLSDNYDSFVTEDEDDAINRILYDMMGRIEKWSGKNNIFGSGVKVYLADWRCFYE